MYSNVLKCTKMYSNVLKGFDWTLSSGPVVLFNPALNAFFSAIFGWIDLKFGGDVQIDLHFYSSPSFSSAPPTPPSLQDSYFGYLD
jgi:hypothetical protein